MTNPTHSKTFQANVDPSIPDDVIDGLIDSYNPETMNNGSLISMLPESSQPKLMKDWEDNDEPVNVDDYRIVMGRQVDKGVTTSIVEFRRVG